MGLGFSHNRFEELEEHRHDPERILEIFKSFDTNDTGLLEGYEDNNFQEGLVQYLYKTRFEGKNHPITFSDLRLFVFQCLNKNSDGKLSQDEVLDNLNKVYDGIDLYLEQIQKK